MNVINESLSTPIIGEYDMIITGGGPSGCGVALSAAREGLKVLLIEKSSALGGMWANGFMNPLFDYENKDGIMHEIVCELQSRNQWGGFWDKSFHNEYMKLILDEKMNQAGVTVLYNSLFSRAIVSEGSVRAIIVENIDGRNAYTATYYVDCTGDGNLAASCGCKYDIGVDNDIKQCQGMTLMFLVGNIPPKYQKGLMIGDILDECYRKEKKEAPFHMPYLIPTPNATFGVVQFTHMYDYNPLSQTDVDHAIIEGRRQMIEAMELLKKHSEDFKDLELICSAPALGIRESRRIICDYTLSLDDVTLGSQFDDAICTVTFGIDIHTKSGKTQDCRKVQAYHIPFRSCIPVDFDNLIVAGRCISGTHEAMASYRVTGNCCKMGDSIGKIVAYATKHNVPIRNVDVKRILNHK